MARRRPRIVMAALLVTATFAVAALAMASTSAKSDLPTSFGIAAPHTGDVANYTFLPVSGFQFDDKVAEGDALWLSFGWMDPAEKRDADGLLRLANPLAVSGWNYVPNGHRTWQSDGQETTVTSSHWGTTEGLFQFRADDGSLLYVGGETDESLAFRSEVAGLPVPVGSGMDLQGHMQVYWDEDMRHCLAWSPLQGTSAAAEPIVLGSACTFDPFPSALPAGTVLTPEGLDELEGVLALRYSTEVPPLSEHVESDGADPLHFDLWYVPGAPYPVRAVIEGEALGYTASLDELIRERVVAEMRLSGLTRGAEPLESHDGLLDRDPVPPLEMAALQPWGLDDAGFDHPFPLRTAFQVAVEDPESRLAAFLQDHPDAFVYASDFAKQSGDQETRLTWSIAVAEAGAQEKWEGTIERIVPFGHLGVPDMLASDSVTEGRGSPWSFIVPQERPGQAPTVASLYARWQAFAGIDIEPGQFGWSLRQVTDVACACPMQGAVGQAREGSFHTASTEGVFPMDMTIGEAVFFPDGRMSYQYAFMADAWTGLASGGGSVDEGLLATSVLERDAWQGLTPAQAAGAGLVAVLLGLLYYAWPTIQAFPALGLFSRVAPDRLLEHPKRQAIREAVAADPGLHFQELRRRTGLSNGTAVHHVRSLVRAGHLEERQHGGYTCYYLDRRQVRQAAGRPAIRASTANAVAALLRDEPGIPGKEIAQRLGIAPATVSYHMARLRRSQAA